MCGFNSDVCDPADGLKKGGEAGEKGKSGGFDYVDVMVRGKPLYVHTQSERATPPTRLPKAAKRWA